MSAEVTMDSVDRLFLFRFTRLTHTNKAIVRRIVGVKNGKLFFPFDTTTKIGLMRNAGIFRASLLEFTYFLLRARELLNKKIHNVNIHNYYPKSDSKKTFFQCRFTHGTVPLCLYRRET